MVKLNKKWKNGWGILMKLNYYIVIFLLSLCLGVVGYLSYQKSTIEQSPRENDYTFKEVSYTDEEKKISKELEVHACEKGTMQSPIQIEYKNVLLKDAPKINIHYEKEPVVLIKQRNQFKVYSKSNTSFISVDNEQYKFHSFHFHLPSEHQIENQNYDMELHLVHENEKGDHAVIAVFIKSGEENEAIKEIWKFIQDENMNEKEMDSFNLLQLIPEVREGYYYSGSLTTPPCTEGVNWIVLEEPIEFSIEQITMFRDVFGHTNRPIQPTNDRKIFKITIN